MKKKEKDNFGQVIADNLNRNVARDNSVFNTFIRDAIRFSTKTHEVYQKQKRKGKDIPYIMHPLTVGLILAKAGAPAYIIVAGILHDTMEDSVPEKKVTYEMLSERFGPSVADIVKDVTEENKSLSWANRKSEALKHLETIDGPSLWVKSADVISNVSEILDDYERDGNDIFLRFNASKKNIIENYKKVIVTIIKRWEAPSHGEVDNPLVLDLKTLASDLGKLE